jgi:hypothetical protein
MNDSDHYSNFCTLFYMTQIGPFCMGALEMIPWRSSQLLIVNVYDQVAGAKFEFKCDMQMSLAAWVKALGAAAALTA